MDGMHDHTGGVPRLPMSDEGLDWAVESAVQRPGGTTSATWTTSRECWNSSPSIPRRLSGVQPGHRRWRPAATRRIEQRLSR